MKHYSPVGPPHNTNLDTYLPQRIRRAETWSACTAAAVPGPFSSPEPPAAWHADSPSLSAVLVPVYFCVPPASAEELKHNQATVMHLL